MKIVRGEWTVLMGSADRSAAEEWLGALRAGRPMHTLQDRAVVDVDSARMIERPEGQRIAANCPFEVEALVDRTRLPDNPPRPEPFRFTAAAPRNVEED